MFEDEAEAFCENLFTKYRSSNKVYWKVSTFIETLSKLYTENLM